MRLMNRFSLEPAEIVIVEDDEELAGRMRHSLAECDLPVTLLTKSSDAVEYIGRHPQSLLILDYVLQYMTADQLIDLLHDAGLAVPFIIVTDQADFTVAVNLMKRGAMDVIRNDDTLLKSLPVVTQRVLDELTLKSRLSRAERDLRRNEEQYRLLYDSMNQGIVYFNRDGRAINANAAAERILGLTLRQMETRLNNSLSPSMIEDDYSPVGDNNPVMQVLVNGDAVRGRILGVYNPQMREYRWINGDVIPLSRGEDGSAETVYCIFEDITEQRAVNEALRYHAGLLDSVSEAVVSTGLDFTVRSWNKAAETIYGWSAGEATGKKIGELLSVDMTAEELSETMDLVMRNGSWSGEVVQHSRDGTRRTMEVSLTLIHDRKGEPNGIIAVNRDISHQKRIESDRSFLASLADSTGDAVIGMDLDGTVLIWNNAAARLYGISADDAVGVSIYTLPPACIEAGFDSVLNDAFRGETVTVTDAHCREKSGDIRFLSIIVQPVRDGEGTIVGAAFVARDLSNRHRLEEQLRIAQRIDSIGNLASGVAHDFNNMLTSIMGNLDLFLEDAEQIGETRLEPLRNAMDTCRLATETVKKIQLLSNQRLYKRTVVDIAEIAGNVFTLLERTTSGIIRKHMEIERGRYYIHASREEVSRMLLNLGTNAVQAIEDRGAVDGDLIKLTAEPVPDALLLRESLPPTPHVHLTLTDTGPGMEKNVLEQVFDPMFTTRNRDTKKGRGLGLSVVYTIVTRAMGGSIRIESAVGEGTAVHLYLPLDTTGKAAAVPDNRETTASRVSSEQGAAMGTILVVDDEESVRLFVEMALTRFGHTVIMASDGNEALDVFRDRHADIDIVILDMAMPRMQGDEVLEKMRGIDADIPVIVSTGKPVENEEVHRHAAAFVDKPYRVRELIDTVAGLLG